MEKKYPVLKCNEELWNEIKPVLESFGINKFDNALNWSLRKYYKDSLIYPFSENKNASNSWSYIVPIEDFDFTAENITINKEKSII